MDRNGQVLDGANINSDDETQSVRKVRSRPLSWSPETDVEGINIKENYCRTGFLAWPNMKQISGQMDTRGTTLL